jgi:hypothetical protein
VSKAVEVAECCQIQIIVDELGRAIYKANSENFFKQQNCFKENQIHLDLVKDIQQIIRRSIWLLDFVSRDARSPLLLLAFLYV